MLAQFRHLSDLNYSIGPVQVERTPYTERSCRISGETERSGHRHNSASIHSLRKIIYDISPNTVKDASISTESKDM